MENKTVVETRMTFSCTNEDRADVKTLAETLGITQSALMCAAVRMAVKNPKQLIDSLDPVRKSELAEIVQRAEHLREILDAAY